MVMVGRSPGGGVSHQIVADDNQAVYVRTRSIMNGYAICCSQLNVAYAFAGGKH